MQVSWKHVIYMCQLKNRAGTHLVSEIQDSNLKQKQKTMSPLKAFIVEDDTWYSQILEYHLLLDPDLEVECFKNGEECLKNLYKKPSIITLDYSLPDYSGHELMKIIQESYPELPIIIISGQSDLTTAVEILKDGAFDYIVKDTDTKSRIWSAVSHIKSNLQLKDKLNKLEDEVIKKYDFSKVIIGNSKEIANVFRIMEKATMSSINVAVKGETGTGKEVVAKAIHYNSVRHKKPYSTPLYSTTGVDY